MVHNCGFQNRIPTVLNFLKKSNKHPESCQLTFMKPGLVFEVFWDINQKWQLFYFDCKNPELVWFSDSGIFKKQKPTIINKIKCLPNTGLSGLVICPIFFLFGAYSF